MYATNVSYNQYRQQINHTMFPRSQLTTDLLISVHQEK